MTFGELFLIAVLAVAALVLLTLILRGIGALAGAFMKGWRTPSGTVSSKAGHDPSAPTH